ncbi:hypothetical protein BJX64DRAFT_294092 [Aspergillus heterothallicus]
MSEDATGNLLTLTYAESYKDKPIEVPDIQRKGQRCDYMKSLFRPKDIYKRTFRFIRVNISVGSNLLVLNELTINKVNYPLQRLASIGPSDTKTKTLWDISVWTLENCMHDYYKDCLFYKQLYALSTALLSQHAQIWSVLSSVATSDLAREIL